MNNNEKKIVVLVGLPGVGKSTYIEQYEDWEVVSSDKYIDMMAQSEGKTYSEVFEKYAKEAQHYADRTFQNAIKNGKNIFIDRTNMSTKSRKKWLTSVPSDYKKEAIVFTLSENIHKERLNKRAETEGKIIPDFVLDNMKSQYNIPTEAEGFHSVKFFHNGKFI